MISPMASIMLIIRIILSIVNRKQDRELELFHIEIVFIFLVDIQEKVELILMIYSNTKYLKKFGMN
jgi:hypothetical protein